MTRRAEIEAFLRENDLAGTTVAPLAGDASARRYFRLPTAGLVLMDAPPGDVGELPAYLAITKWLGGEGVSVPFVKAAKPDLGLALLEDLGDDLFARVLETDPGAETDLYRAATELLAQLQQRPAPPGLPPYDLDFALKESALAVEWYAPGADLDALTTCLRDALTPHLSEDVLVHRDYHAENLFWLPEREGTRRVGLIDFQGARAGHWAYDLASLVYDARRDVTAATRMAAIAQFASATGRAAEDVEPAVACWGAQRNLKILGIFVRLAQTMGKSRYLDLLPRVRGQLDAQVRHPSLAPLRAWVETHLPPAEAPLRDAMIFAAGFGTRMRPLTDDRPKPMVNVAGRPLIDHALTHLQRRAPDRPIVINLHHKGDQIRAHLDGQSSIAFSEEAPDILETGGGLAKARPLFTSDAVLTMNPDGIWQGACPVDALEAAWSPDEMDALLLLVPTAQAIGHKGPGDFFCDERGALSRRGARPTAPLVYTGAQIIALSALDEAPEGPFSLNLIWDKLLATGRLHGLVFGGQWADVGYPEAIPLAEALLAPQAG